MHTVTAAQNKLNEARITQTPEHPNKVEGNHVTFLNLCIVTRWTHSHCHTRTFVLGWGILSGRALCPMLLQIYSRIVPGISFLPIHITSPFTSIVTVHTPSWCNYRQGTRHRPWTNTYPKHEFLHYSDSAVRASVSSGRPTSKWQQTAEQATFISSAGSSFTRVLPRAFVGVVVDTVSDPSM